MVVKGNLLATSHVVSVVSVVSGVSVVSVVSGVSVVSIVRGVSVVSGGTSLQPSHGGGPN